MRVIGRHITTYLFPCSHQLVFPIRKQFDSDRLSEWSSLLPPPQLRADGRQLGRQLARLLVAITGRVSLSQLRAGGVAILDVSGVLVVLVLVVVHQAILKINGSVTKFIFTRLKEYNALR